MIPHFSWLSSPHCRVLETRKRLNRAIEKFLPFFNGFSYSHLDLKGGIPGLYRQNGVHRPDIGLDLFNLGL